MYNSAWDISFVMPLSPGKHLFDIGPSYAPDNTPYIFSISLDLIQNHKYFIGHYLVGPTDIRNYNYKWFPIVLDKISREIVFPVNSIPWQGKNIRNMEVPYIIPVK